MDDRPPLRTPREQVLRNPVHVLGNHRVGYTQDTWGRTIVLIQDYVLVTGELDEPVRLRSPPFINRLVRVPHHEKVAVAGGQFLDDLPVVGVAVLSLIHHDVVQLALPVLPGILEMVQDIVGKVLQVVEIQGIVLHLPVDVIGSRGSQHPVRPDHVRKHVCVDIAVEGLGGRYLAQEFLDRLLGTLDPELFHALFGKGLAVFLVDD